MNVDQKLTVQIKGIREGLLVTLGEGDWADIQDILLSQIAERGNFFQGARVALDVGNQILHAVEMSALRNKLSEKGIALWAILSNSPLTEQTAQVLGLATRLYAPRPDRAVRTLDTNLSGDNAIVVQRTLRSGYKVSSKGHVVVIGDVNPGAEIIAGGSVVVWGRLRGVVQAGADGDEQAIVCALDLAPTQLRIAAYISITPQRKGKAQPEIAKIKDGQLIAEPWNYKEGGK
jgi:septum site-determining protein MinC